MKKTLLTLAIITVAQFSYAQFSSSGGNTTTSDNVGIGTTSPGALLHLYKATDASEKIESGGGNYTYLQLATPTSSGDGYLVKNISTANSMLDKSLYLWNSIGPIQFSPGGVAGGTVTFLANGNVGIGTTSPGTKLHVAGSNDMFKLENTDGTTANQYTQMELVAGTAHNYIWTNNQNSPGFFGGSGALNLYTGSASPIAFFTNGSSTPQMVMASGGNVGIGTTTPDQLLSVAGTIHSKQVKVDLIGWPDYVFKPKYHLPSLLEIKTYVDKNHHLPGIPSEQDVAKNGINLGEMNKLLVKKVEELTLYQIEQDARIAALEKALSKLTVNK